jgi:hypothetical protein
MKEKGKIQSSKRKIEKGHNQKGKGECKENANNNNNKKE